MKTFKPEDSIQTLKQRVSEKVLKRTVFGYFLHYWKIFLVVSLLSFAIGYFLCEKKVITAPEHFNHWFDLLNITGRNTLVFGYILFSIYTSKINIYGMVVLNGCIVGVIISQFAHAQYLIMLLPHGILEMSVFFMLGAIVSKYIDKKETNWKTLIKPVSILYIGLIASAVIEAWITPFLTVKYCYGL